MAGMHVDYDAEECPEILSVVCIFPSVLHRLFLNLGKTGGKIHTTESTSGHSSASELTCIPAMARKETALVVLSLTL